MSKGKKSGGAGKRRKIRGGYHMHVNRLVRSAQRAHELVLYDFLARLYAAQSARSGRPRSL